MNSGKFGTQAGTFSINLNSKKQKFILLGILMSILLLVVALLVIILQSRTATASKIQETTEAVAAATNNDTIVLFTPAKPVPAGTSLGSVELRELMWPKAELPVGAVDDLAMLHNKFAKVDLKYGEPILAINLTDTPEGALIKISPGMRAVTIDISAKHGVEGWAMPGNSVDVVLTHIDEGQLTSKVVVENSRILSTGGDASTATQRFASGRNKIAASSTVTLELSPTDALKIETAQQMGNLSLHMRADEDHLTSGIDSVKQADFSDTKKPAGPECNKGKMMIGGQEYWLDCDGKLVQ